MLPKSAFRCFIFLIWTMFQAETETLEGLFSFNLCELFIVIKFDSKFWESKGYINAIWQKQSSGGVLLNDCFLYETKHRIMDVSKLVKSQALSNTWKSIILVSSQNYIKPGLLMATPKFVTWSNRKTYFKLHIHFFVFLG